MLECRSRWSSAKFSQTATHGRKVVLVSSWKLLASTTWSVSEVDASTCSLRGYADIPAYEHSPAGRRQHPSKQRGRCRLSLRAGDGKYPAENPPRRELELADDLDAPLACHLKDWLLHRDAGAHDNEIGGRQRVPPMATKLQLDAPRSQPVRGVKAVARLRERHVRALPREQFRRRDATAGRRRQLPRDAPERRRFCDPQHHRSFSVVRLNSAKITDRIKNRVFTLGSLHPLSSK